MPARRCGAANLLRSPFPSWRMDPKDAVLLGVFSIVVCVPVLAITARIALKPIVDSLVRLREAGYGSPGGGGAVERRVIELEDEVKQLRQSLSGLEETVA